MKDNELIGAFLSDFVAQLTEKFPFDIDFILLFGSAARGEFRAGISDVDMIIQVKNEPAKAKVDCFAEKLFWKLDKKHGTRLHEVCSTKRDDIFSILEKTVKLYKPFEVLGPEDIRWEEGRIKNRALGTFAAIAPVSQFAKKLKKEGRILYGRNILKEIKVNDSLVDKFKGVFLPYILSVFAWPLAVAIPDKALKYSIKAVLYSVDDMLDLLDSNAARPTPLKMRILREHVGEYYSIRLAKEALHAKRNFERIKKEWTYLDKLAFCLQAPVYIAHNNLMGFLSFLKTKAGLKV